MLVSVILGEVKKNWLFILGVSKKYKIPGEADDRSIKECQYEF